MGEPPERNDDGDGEKRNIAANRIKKNLERFQLFGGTEMQEAMAMGW